MADEIIKINDVKSYVVLKIIFLKSCRSFTCKYAVLLINIKKKLNEVLTKCKIIEFRMGEKLKIAKF